MTALRSFWLLLLLAVFSVPVVAQDDDLFGKEPAEAEAVKERESRSALVKPARKLHSQDEIKAELIRRNAQLATEMSKFIELNKQVAKQAVDGGNHEALMPILREYGPAVIRTKQLWNAVVGNPTRYDTWLGSADYWRAWVAFHHSWQSLYGYVDRFAAVDLGLADQLTDALTTLGTSFQDYSDWVDEWDRELGNDKYVFSRGNANLNELDQQQLRDEEDADAELNQAAEAQQMEEEDETAPSETVEGQQDIEDADKKELIEGEEKADAAADAAEKEDEPFGDAANEDDTMPAEEKEPAAGEDDLFGEEPATEEDKPADDKAAGNDTEAVPAKESADTEEESGDDLFGDADAREEEAKKEDAKEDQGSAAEADSEEESGDETAKEEESPQEEEAPKDSEEESADDLFGDG